MRRRLARTFVRLVGPALLVAVLLKMPDRGAILRALGAAAPLPLLLACLLNVLNIHLKVVRWDILLRTRGIVYPKRRAWASFLTSLYVGLLTPGRVGDILRAQYLRADLGVPYAEGLASIVMDRLCDLWVLAAFVAWGIVRYSSVMVGSLAWITWGGVILTLVGPLVFLIPGVAERLMRGAWSKLSGAVAAFSGAPADADHASSLDRFLAALRANAGRSLLRTIPITVLTFVVAYVQGWLAARAIGVPLSFTDATCLSAIASLLGLLPISVSGVGVRELFFALIFPLLGFTPEQGVTFGLLVFFVIYLVIAGIGFVSWMIAPPPSTSSKAPLALEGEGGEGHP